MAKRKKTSIPSTAVKIVILIVLASALGIISCQQFYKFLVNADYFSIKAVMIDSSLSFIDKGEFAHLNGKNIFSVNLNKIQRVLSSKYPQVSDLRIMRRFPNQIHIKAKTRFPLAQIKTGQKFLTIDEKGIVLSSSTSKEEKMPLILTRGENYPRYSLGLPLAGSDYTRGLDIIKSFNITRSLSSYQIDLIEINNISKIDVYLSNKLNVILDASNIPQKVQVLGFILAQEKIDFKEVKYIDLRFKEPIVGKK